MRIISGKLKGRSIQLPKKMPVRPTTEKAREGLFNILENRFEIKKIKFLDLFAGSGSISYEFASRGCNDITAVDNHHNCIKYIQQIKKKFNINIDILKLDALKIPNYIKKRFNIIFADPPYNYKKHEEIKKSFLSRNMLEDNGCLIIEHDQNTKFDSTNIELRKYGTVHFSIFQL